MSCIGWRSESFEAIGPNWFDQTTMRSEHVIKLMTVSDVVSFRYRSCASHLWFHQPDFPWEKCSIS